MLEEIPLRSVESKLFDNERVSGANGQDISTMLPYLVIACIF